MPTFASADTLAKTKTIEEIATDHKNVKSAVAVVFAKKALVAIQPKDIVGKTQYKEVKEELKAAIMKAHPEIDTVYVTMRAEVYKELEYLAKKNDAEAQTRIEEIMKAIEEFHNKRERIVPLPVR
jgi:hypothetical protein